VPFVLEFIDPTATPELASDEQARSACTSELIRQTRLIYFDLCHVLLQVVITELLKRLQNGFSAMSPSSQWVNFAGETQLIFIPFCR
jgi:hypothetical protein